MGGDGLEAGGEEEEGGQEGRHDRDGPHEAVTASISHNISGSHCYHWCLLLTADPLALEVKGVAAIWT